MVSCLFLFTPPMLASEGATAPLRPGSYCNYTDQQLETLALESGRSTVFLEIIERSKFEYIHITPHLHKSAQIRFATSFIKGTVGANGRFHNAKGIRIGATQNEDGTITLTRQYRSETKTYKLVPGTASVYEHFLDLFASVY